jgi:hypothetical protein
MSGQVHLQSFTPLSKSIDLVGECIPVIKLARSEALNLFTDKKSSN